MKTKAVEFEEQIDRENQRYRIRICVQKDPPERLSLIAGDVFNCLRASLDHLVWSLATHTTGAYAERTQFPILEKKDQPRLEQQASGIPGRPSPRSNPFSLITHPTPTGSKYTFFGD